MLELNPCFGDLMMKLICVPANSPVRRSLPNPRASTPRSISPLRASNPQAPAPRSISPLRASNPQAHTKERKSNAGKLPGLHFQTPPTSPTPNNISFQHLPNISHPFVLHWWLLVGCPGCSREALYQTPPHHREFPQVRCTRSSKCHDPMTHHLVVYGPFRRMEAWRNTLEPQKSGDFPGPGPEIVERQRVVKERATQRARSWTVQNEMGGILGRMSVGSAGRILDSANPREIGA